MMTRNPLPLDPFACRAALVAHFQSVAARDRWGLALVVLGWMHLAYCFVYHAIYVPDDSRATLSIVLWISEIAAVVAVMRVVTGQGWYKSSPLGGIVVRVWATYLILAFNVATLNSLTGWDVDWFKLVWCTLGSFGFATMAWLMSPWYLILAFQMYFTGLAMVKFPQYTYLIHGSSWCLGLTGLGIILERRRARLLAQDEFEAEAVGSASGIAS